jgi:transcriptional regulator with XRE-family HTH domain
MTKKEIGQRIREIRLGKGMSQEAFAKLLGYASRSSVNKLEEGVAELSFDKAAIIIDKFGPEALDLLLPLASSTLALENDCLICQRISDALKGTNPNFVAELSTGIVCLGDNQRFPGYTYFLSKTHVHELHELPGSPNGSSSARWPWSKRRSPVFSNPTR